MAFFVQVQTQSLSPYCTNKVGSSCQCQNNIYFE
jgi:hypothetical protein